MLLSNTSRGVVIRSYFLAKALIQSQAQIKLCLSSPRPEAQFEENSSAQSLCFIMRSLWM